jgi:hypothetical protein
MGFERTTSRTGWIVASALLIGAVAGQAEPPRIGSGDIQFRLDMAQFRADPRFQQLVRDSGLLDYWRSVGWPDLCRPAGDGVVCDR